MRGNAFFAGKCAHFYQLRRASLKAKRAGADVTTATADKIMRFMAGKRAQRASPFVTTTTTASRVSA